MPQFFFKDDQKRCKGGGEVLRLPGQWNASASLSGNKSSTNDETFERWRSITVKIVSELPFFVHWQEQCTSEGVFNWLPLPNQSGLPMWQTTFGLQIRNFNISTGNLRLTTVSEEGCLNCALYMCEVKIGCFSRKTNWSWNLQYSPGPVEACRRGNTLLL